MFNSFRMKGVHIVLPLLVFASNHLIIKSSNLSHTPQTDHLQITQTIPGFMTYVLQGRYIPDLPDLL